MTVENQAAGDQPLDNDDFDAAFEEFARGQTAEGGEEQAPPRPAADTHDDALDDDQGDAAGGDDLTARLQALEAENQRLKHSDASQRGRLGAYQRQINDLQRQLQSHTAQQPTGHDGTPANDAQQKQDMAESMGLDDWETFKEDFPDMARAFEARLAADRQKQAQLERQIAELQSAVQPIQQQAHDQYLQSEYARLEARHSDWREVVNAPRFQQWLQTQPTGIQELAGSDSADDASALMDLFKATHGIAGDSRADAQDKRRDRLAAAQTVPRRGASPRDGVPDEFEAAFKHYANRKR